LYEVFFLIEVNEMYCCEVSVGGLPYGLEPCAENVILQEKSKVTLIYLDEEKNSSSLYRFLEKSLQEILNKISFQKTAYYQVVSTFEQTKVPRVI
jgi:hypothetical protein